MDNIQTKSLRLLLNLSLLDFIDFKRYPFIKSAGVYGSFSKGTNVEESDIDMWVLVDEYKEEELARFMSDLRKRLGNVKSIYLTPNKIKALKEQDTIFYHALVFGSIVIYGDLYHITKVFPDFIGRFR